MSDSSVLTTEIGICRGCGMAKRLKRDGLCKNCPPAKEQNQ